MDGDATAASANDVAAEIQSGETMPNGYRPLTYSIPLSVLPGHNEDTIMVKATGDDGTTSVTVDYSPQDGTQTTRLTATPEFVEDASVSVVWNTLEGPPDLRRCRDLGCCPDR